MIKKRKVALLLKGAISIRGGVIRGAVKDVNDYVNYKIIKNSIDKFILEPNKNLADFDFYIHCWNTDLEKNLCELYDPVKSIFVKNEPILRPYAKYGDHAMRQISQSIAIKQGIELIESTYTDYDQLIIYRPDVLLWKNMSLEKYDLDKMYVNAHQDHGGSAGDFHFVMNMENASHFKNLVNSLEYNPPKVHRWIKNYVINHMKQDLLMDDIIPPMHQEVLRKIIKNKNEFVRVHFKNNELQQMNLSIDDIF